MITMTFKDFYQTDWDEGQHELYVLKRGSDVLYIGIARRGIWNRWFGFRSPHIMKNLWGEMFPGSQAGRAVIENLPQSWEWTMEVWTLEDCAKFLDMTDKRFTEIHQVEPLMIEKLQPRLNVTYATSYHKDTSDLIDRSHLGDAHRDVFG